VELDLFGCRVKDGQTGYEGIATARIDFHTGCTHWEVEATTLKKDGTMTESYQFDPQRLTVLHRPTVACKVREPKLELWSVVQDRITGFPGFVSAMKTSLYGPPQICIEPDRRNPEGELNMPQWFFESRVLLISKPRRKTDVDLPQLQPEPPKRRGGPSPYGSGIPGLR